jgi:two-component system sensor histidine kinase KdpD
MPPTGKERPARRPVGELLDGLEVLRRRPLRYRGAEFGELDVDAVLARRPRQALVDELAHTNVPGARNAKRHQDVEELLAAGIDVVTTLNVAHLESLGVGVPPAGSLPGFRSSSHRPHRAAC